MPSRIKMRTSCASADNRLRGCCEFAIFDNVIRSSLLVVEDLSLGPGQHARAFCFAKAVREAGLSADWKRRAPRRQERGSAAIARLPVQPSEREQTPLELEYARASA